MLKLTCQASVPRDVFPPTPPGPEGSNGNGLLRVQWVAGAWLVMQRDGTHLVRQNQPGPVSLKNNVAACGFGLKDGAIFFPVFPNARVFLPARRSERNRRHLGYAFPRTDVEERHFPELITRVAVKLGGCFISLPEFAVWSDRRSTSASGDCKSPRKLAGRSVSTEMQEGEATLQITSAGEEGNFGFAIGNHRSAK